jgi:hypothetical protein
VLTRQQIANFYRPVAAKPIQTGINAAPGQTPSILNIDLSLPLEGVRFVYKARIAVATANYTSVTPEGVLNLCSDLQIFGTNKRQNGNVTLLDLDLASIFGFKQLFGLQPDQLIINGVNMPVGNTPWPSGTATTSYFLGTTAGSPYDVEIIWDIPFYPFHMPPSQRPGFIVRSQEWADSLQIKAVFPNVTDNATNPLGVSAATTVTTFTAFGSGAGNPTLDVYSLPVIMGDIAGGVLPGFCSRTQQPFNPSVIQNTGTNVTLLQLQKQATSRILVKTGTGTLPPSFTTLTDRTNITALGVTVGANRFVRNTVDTRSIKQDFVRQYNRYPIQGYMGFEFLQSGNVRSAYPGDQVGPGSTFQLVGNVTGLANAIGIVVQEQVMYQPEGTLYNI